VKSEEISPQKVEENYEAGPVFKKIKQETETSEATSSVLKQRATEIEKENSQESKRLRRLAF